MVTNSRRIWRRLGPGMLLGAALLCSAVPAGADRTTRYQYDGLGRLVTVQEDRPNATVSTYQIDAAGNRKRVIVTTPARVPNGSFETPAISCYQYNSSKPDVTFVGAAAIAVNGDAWGFPTPWAGRQVAIVQAAHGEAASVELTAANLVPGRTYRYAFAAAQRPNFPGNSLKVYIGGNLVWDAIPASATQFSTYPTGSFLASEATSKIRFSSTSTSYNFSSAVDAVSIERLNYWSNRARLL